MTKTEPGIFHADLWGMRKQKYHMLLEADIKSVPWKALEPAKPHYLFIPQSEEQREEYEQGWKVTDIFPFSTMGIITKRDFLTIKLDAVEIWKTVKEFAETPVSQLHERFDLPPDNDWVAANAHEDIVSSGTSKTLVKDIAYAPFDKRYTYYTGNTRGFMARPVFQMMRHMQSENTAISLIRKLDVVGDWTHAFCCNGLMTHHAVSMKEGNYLFPLYLYPPSKEERKSKAELFEAPDPFQSKDRIENLSPEFRTFVDKQYGHHYSPEEILGYTYAVLHSPSYRENYLEFLKIDFPYIPFVDDRETFEALSKLGWELVQGHLLKMIPKEPKVGVTKGGFKVEKPIYDAQQQRLYINKEQYFSPVSPEVWEFHIGGYQVLDKYLKSRKSRTLSLDEIENIQHIVKTLAFTILQMQKIDESWQP